VVATVGATIPSIEVEISEAAQAAGRTVSLTPHVVDGAFDAMAEGDGATHDRLVAEAAAKIADADVIVLAQFTLSRAASSVAAVTDIPVLNSPGAAVEKMRELVGG
jgi:Asp/Glu/hydantoin racemase